MRSMKICSAMIYFMARGESINKIQVFGQQGNPVYAIWPVGRKWGVAYHDGKKVSVAFLYPLQSEQDAYANVINHYYKYY